jgi:hypothetical protein
MCSQGCLPHPEGFIKAEFRVGKGVLKGSVELPEGVSGTPKHSRTAIDPSPDEQEI